MFETLCRILTIFDQFDLSGRLAAYSNRELFAKGSLEYRIGVAYVSQVYYSSGSPVAVRDSSTKGFS